jgi:hypothetical protein
MNENDNILIEQFFREAASQQIRDNGFSDRVMERIEELPRTSHLAPLLSTGWTLFCIAVALLVFFWLHGWSELATDITIMLTYVEVFVRIVPTMLDMNSFIHVPASSSVVTVVLSLLVLMVLSIIGLTRWASRLV